MRWLVLALPVVLLAGCGSSGDLDGTAADAAGDDATTGEHDAGRPEGGVARMDATVGDAGHAQDDGGAGRDDGGDGASDDAGGDATGAPADAGGADSAASSDADSDGASDAAGAADAPADAPADAGDGGATEGGAADGGALAACGDARGLQAGAPWPMRGRCPTRMARADVAGPARANLKWSQRIAPAVNDVVDYGSIVSSPVVAADGTIYVGVEGTGSVPSGLVAFAPDGTPKWHYDTGTFHVRSGAVIRADGSVVFASSDGTVVALEASGQRRWSTNVGAQAFASPLVGPDGMLYVGTQGGMTALHADGTIAWSQPGCIVGSGGASLRPDGSIIYNCGSALTALLPSGAPGTSGLGAVDEDQTIYAPPTIGADGAVWFGGLTAHQVSGISYYATLYSYSRAAGFQKREFGWAAGAFFNAPALLPNGDAVVGAPYPTAASGDALVAAPVAGGFSSWAAYTDRITAQPSVDVDGNVYFVAGTTLVSLGANGALRWTGAVDSTVQIGIAIGGDGTLYVGTVNGWLYAYAP